MRTPQELHRLREQAITLRRQGKSLRQIKEILRPHEQQHWVRDLPERSLPIPSRDPGRYRGAAILALPHSRLCRNPALGNWQPTSL